jgi:uncharacterized protein Veg
LSKKILIRRGLKANLPELNISELGFCTDTLELYIGSYTGNVLIGEEKISNNIPLSSYTLELTRWNVKSDGTDALNTTNGINGAIIWASQNGYTQICLPKGIYLIDETKSIKPVSFITLNLNGSTLKVRSNNLEKYQMVKFEHVKFARITNGILEGDRETHVYEKDGVDADTHEGGIGINIFGDSRFITVDNLEILNMTGDGIITTNSFPDTAHSLRQSQCESGTYSLIDGTPVSNSNRIRFTTKILMDNLYINEAGHWGVYGNGYGNLGTGIISSHYDVVFYNSDDTFHSSIPNVQFFEEVPKRKDASYARVVFHQGNIPTDDTNLTLVRVNRHPEKIFFEKLDIHHCRRQGMSLIGKYIYVRDNEIHHIGGSTYETGTDPQGGIDIEDGYDLNQHFFIERNHFHNNWGYDLVITNGKYMNIRANRFNKVSKYVSVALTTKIDDSIFVDNVIFQSQVAISGEFQISGNRYYGSTISFGNSDSSVGRSIDINDEVYHNCLVTLNQIVPLTIKLNGCKFFNDSSKLNTFISIGNSLTLRGEPQTITNCTFDGEDSVAVIYNLNPKNGWILENLQFLNIKKGITLPSGSIKGCRFSDITTINFHSLSTDAEIDFIGNTIKSIEKNNPLLILNGIKRFNMENCYIEKKDSQLFIIQNINDKVMFKNNSFTYTNITLNRPILEFQSTFTGISILFEYNIFNLPSPRSLVTNTLSNNPNVIFRNNSMNGVSVTRKNETFINNIVDGVIDPYYKVTDEPISGYYNLGQKLEITNPVSGGHMYYIATTGGTANKTPWIASTSYSVNSAVNANGKVYKCTAITTGISGTIAPSHTNGTVTDNGVTWQYVDSLAVFKQAGVIL